MEFEKFYQKAFGIITDDHVADLQRLLELMFGTFRVRLGADGTRVYEHFNEVFFYNKTPDSILDMNIVDVKLYKWNMTTIQHITIRNILDMNEVSYVYFSLDK